GGRTLLGLSGIPATRFRGVVRFLEEFADGQDADMPERPADVPLPNFIRYCADDLKTLYVEGHLAMKPGAGGEEIARWFWGETGAGRLLRRVRDRLHAPDDTRAERGARALARPGLEGRRLRDRALDESWCAPQAVAGLGPLRPRRG